VVETGSSFFQLIETTDPERLVTFSSHSMSFKALVEVGYWSADMISEDSGIFWKSYLHFDGQYQVVPMPMTLSMDIVAAGSWWGTVRSLYKQKRRWAWGVENFPLVMRGFLANKKISFYDYTKHKLKYLSFISNKLPANYHITFSGDENTGNIGQWFDDILNHAENTDKKASMALAFYPADYNRILESGYIVTPQGKKIPVIDGDKTDYRPSDPKICIVALKAKGRAKKSLVGGFVKAFVAGEII
jgi:hypothetical protein